MIWLENRELMQSMGLSSLLSHSLLICLSHVFLFYHFFSLSISLLFLSVENNICTQFADKLVKHIEPGGWSQWQYFELFKIFYWLIVIEKKNAKFSFTIYTETHGHAVHVCSHTLKQLMLTLLALHTVFRNFFNINSSTPHHSQHHLISWGGWLSIC